MLPPIDANIKFRENPTYGGDLPNDYLKYMERVLVNYDSQQSNCNFTSGQRITGDYNTPCRFPKSLLGPCADPRKYMGTTGNICVYLTMNKVGFVEAGDELNYEHQKISFNSCFRSMDTFLISTERKLK